MSRILLTKEQLEEYANELDRISRIIQLYNHTVEAFSVTSDDDAKLAIANSFLGTQFEQNQDLMTMLNKVAIALNYSTNATELEGYGIPYVTLYCPSRDELRELYWRSETETRQLTDKQVVETAQEFSALLDDLKKEWGFDKFSLFDNKLAELSGLNEQERYINGFYAGMKYAQSGKLEV